ncbi:TetR family transcriptional regulator [Actinorhabdospora filicis]|uniref:TetR family transcriptional regulator n=1 Tax=Actinorhabdospora filicis TaxID=1785913 RepID=A0A9W6SR39_9ACTN|nr:TetR/AcrR family transcriptional regulator [Actinorhabdospora filicis]GLZ80327.1 TetR family transcriptional regulator [Actinorhabdospora filicis]
MSDAMTGLLWDGARPPARGPRPGLSLEQITAEAIALADAEGIGALTMPALAKRLSAGTMSLYRYVPGKDELIALMIDTAVGAAPGFPGEWREAVTGWALALHRTFFRHQWLLDVVTRPRVMGPRELGWLEAGLSAASSMPLPPELRFLVLLVVNAQVRGVVGDQIAEEDQARRPMFTPEMLRERGRAGDFPQLMAVMDAIDFTAPPAPGDAEERFLFGLSLLLDGVESFIRAA